MFTGCYGHQDLADFFGVDVTTIDNWKNNHPSFFGSIRQGKVVADANVASSLYERSLGVTCSEEKEVVTTERDGESRTIKTATKKEYPPDTQAMRLWLLNRRPRQWSETHHVKVETEDQKLIVILSPEMHEKMHKAAGESLDYQVIDGECEQIEDGQ